MAGDQTMKLTKIKLRELIKEEMRMVIAEEDNLDLAALQPAVDKAAKAAFAAVQTVSKDKNTQRMILTALISQITKTMEDL